MHTENKHLALKLYSAVSVYFTLLKKVFTLEYTLHLKSLKLFIKIQLPRALIYIT